MNLHCCHEMNRHIAENEVAICYNEKFREYGIKILDGGNSKQLINFCPWCGKKLPESLRDLWFEEIEKRGLEPDNTKIPKEFLSAQWWRIRFNEE